MVEYYNMKHDLSHAVTIINDIYITPVQRAGKYEVFIKM